MLSEVECYRAVCGRDARFDGVFFTAVLSTGIYCRPSCSARTPLQRNVRFFPTAASAQSAGFRACKRCRPGAAPGSPEWNVRADLAGRAMRFINDGVVDTEGVNGLATRLGYSARQVHRQLVTELGASPIAIARARRCETSRLLIETTQLPMSQVAFAAGFSSIRQFNETIRSVYAQSPTEMRNQHASLRRSHQRSDGNAITIRLAFRPPIDLGTLFHFLAVRSVDGIEESIGQTYRRVVRLPHGMGILASSPARANLRAGYLEVDLWLDDLRDLTTAVARSRRLFDLDADPIAIRDALLGDPLLNGLVLAQEGLRLPGHVDAEELAIRAVLGQQISVAAARKLTSTLVERYGEPLKHPVGSLTHAFPTSTSLGAHDELDLPMPKTRRRTIVAVARAIAEGRVDLSTGADREQAALDLERVPGIGPWTSSYVRMRGLSDPDAFLPSDVGVRRALERLGVPGDPKSAQDYAQAWRPWRSYGLIHLWNSPVLDLDSDNKGMHA